MGMDPQTTFWDALRALPYKDMKEVADEISCFIPDKQRIDGAKVAAALSDAAAGKPTRAKRGTAQ